MITPAALKALDSGSLENFIAAATPGGIERQEAQGQQAFCAADMIPKDTGSMTREQLETLGFVFGDDVDDIFVQCKLPAGWKKVATNHSMHSDIVDEQGRKRASVFYKAAFYDRSAHLNLCNRFSYTNYHGDENDAEYSVVATDGGKVMHNFGKWPKTEYAKCDSLEREARAWLSQQYPDWTNPTAYWEI